MEQNCSSKVVSLHYERCSGYCPNASSCYHLKKNIGVYSLVKGIEFYLDKGYKVHESICGLPITDSGKLLERYPNYNITISSDIASKVCIQNFVHQIQITVYDLNKMFKYKDYQKLYLINSDDSYNYAKIILDAQYDIGRIHFLFDQDYITPSKIFKFIQFFEKNRFDGASVDSCLTSWLVNGQCPNMNGNYLDETFDGTFRKCPYAKNGKRLSTYEVSSVEEMFHEEILPERCKYAEMFKGELYERSSKNSSVQSDATDHKCRSNGECVRGLPLWNEGS